MKNRMTVFLALITSIQYVALASDIFTGFLELETPCFPVFENPPCNRTLVESFHPKSPIIGINQPTTKVFLFTPASPEKAEQLHLCGGQLPPSSSYDPEADTEIFIHGWLDGVCKTAWMKEMKEQLFVRGRYNVILIDWSWGNTPDYFAASQNCKVVGEQVGFIVNNIMHQMEITGEKFHIIGHSYGAIAAGFIGRMVKGLRRITGLDPAYPAKKDDPPDQILTYRDAKIVDNIHSNSGQCVALFIGDIRALGHVDFYPEGGQFQTSCYSNILTSFLKLDLLYGFASLSPTLCSHLQSLQFYKVSINSGNCQFVGIECSSYKNLRNCVRNNRRNWAVMGMDFEKYYLPSNKRPRKYYLTVADVCPYTDNSYLKQGRFPSNLSCSAFS